jgi:hypothetical protein
MGSSVPSANHTDRGGIEMSHDALAEFIEEKAKELGIPGAA